jgi:hypothetical protein
VRRIQHVARFDPCIQGEKIGQERDFVDDADDGGDFVG